MGLFSSLLGSATDFLTGNSKNFLSDTLSNASAAATGGNSTLGSIISAAGSYLGGTAANAASSQSVKDQMAFQQSERLSTYPDTVTSLKNAGLNPMLAYTQGGLPVPSGASYTAQDTLTPAVNSFNQTKATSSAATLQAAQTASTATQADLNKALVSKAKADSIQSLSSARQADATAQSIKADLPQKQTKGDLWSEGKGVVDSILHPNVLKNINSAASAKPFWK